MSAAPTKIIGIDHEPAFNWWVPHILKKRDRIISCEKAEPALFETNA